MKVTRGGVKLTSAEILVIVHILVGISVALYAHHNRPVQVKRENRAKETAELVEAVLHALVGRPAKEE